MKRLIPFLAISLLVSTSSALASPTISYLYAISGKKVTVEHSGNGEYELKIPLASANPIIQFSDRPYRIRHTISADTLKKIWYSGNKHSFAATPPNAILEIPGVGSKLVNLTGFHTSHQQSTYQFKLSALHTKLPKNWLHKNLAFANLTID